MFDNEIRGSIIAIRPPGEVLLPSCVYFAFRAPNGLSTSGGVALLCTRDVMRAASGRKTRGAKRSKELEEIGKEVDTRGPQRSGRMFVIHLPLREKMKNNSDTHQGVNPKLALVPTSFSEIHLI
jgi:hypothetical protein